MTTPRLACIDLPALPLQCLVRREPELKTLPAVIVDELHPQGTVQWTNRAARLAGIRTGMRYGPALGLCGQLRAGLVSQAEQQAAITEIAAIIRTLTPLVEPERHEPGVFWADASGLARVAAELALTSVTVDAAADGLPLQTGGPPLLPWALTLRQRLLEAGWHAAVVVGFDRLATYAIARHFHGVRVLADEAAEGVACARVQLASLGPVCGLAPKLRDELERLGVDTLGDLHRLPETALRERMGTQIAHLRRRLAHDVPQPLHAEVPVVPVQLSREFEPPDQNSERLLFAAKSLLGLLLPLLVDRQEAVEHLELRLDLDLHDHPPVLTTVKPAVPTLEERPLLDLLRLRLEATPLPAAVKTLTLHLRGVPATSEQLALWQLASRRDPRAAAGAFARLRALFGPEAVVVATPRSAWLPEGQFVWTAQDGPLPDGGKRFQSSEPALLPSNVILLTPPPQHLPAIRRLLTQPVRLPPQPPAPRPWRLTPVHADTVLHLHGPYRLTGGWWRAQDGRRDRAREYAYLHTTGGLLLWVFRDPAHDQWFWQGA